MLRTGARGRRCFALGNGAVKCGIKDDYTLRILLWKQCYSLKALQQACSFYSLMLFNLCCAVKVFTQIKINEKGAISKRGGFAPPLNSFSLSSLSCSISIVPGYLILSSLIILLHRPTQLLYIILYVIKSIFRPGSIHSVIPVQLFYSVV